MNHRIRCHVFMVNGNTETYRMEFTIYVKRPNTVWGKVRGVPKFSWVVMGEGHCLLETNCYFEALTMRRVANRFCRKYGKLPNNITEPMHRWGKGVVWKQGMAA